jgi:hypothetical protein
MIDLGLVDPRHDVGFELEPAVYDQLKAGGWLSRFQYRFRRDANGQISRSESGLTFTQLFDPTASQAVGPVAHLHICRGVFAVPNRVGVVFFHRLAGCKIYWELDHRTWTVEFP